MGAAVLGHRADKDSAPGSFRSSVKQERNVASIVQMENLWSRAGKRLCRPPVSPRPPAPPPGEGSTPTRPPSFRRWHLPRTRHQSISKTSPCPEQSRSGDSQARTHVAIDGRFKPHTR